MKSTVKAFQDLYVSFGGSLTDTYSDIAGGIPVGDYNVKPDMIEALAKITGGSIELPKVTSSDNGKVLGVVSGAWNKMDAPSGSDPFIATFSGSNGGTCDKTFAEIKAAIDAGRAVFASITSSNVDVNPGSLFPVSYYSSEIIGFSCYYVHGDDYMMMCGDINSNNMSYFITDVVSFH